MKKLLALVLCVMMFVSVLPTAAFAGGYDVDDPLYSVAGYNKQITNMIKNTKKNVEKAYKALVGDQVVYTSAKAMDDTIVDMVNAITDPLIEKGKANKAFADGVKNNIRHYLDEVVADKIADNYYKALDSDGKRDDLKYAQLVAESINKALTDKKFVAGYQAVATYFALGQIVSDIRDNLKDEYEAFQDSIDPKFQARFAAEYTNLVDDYIDTLGTATLKVLESDLAELAYDDAVADAKADYAATLAAAGLARDAAIEKAEEDLAKVVDPAEEKLDKALDKAESDLDDVKTLAQTERTYAEDRAQALYDVAMADNVKKRDADIAAYDAQYETDMKAAGTDKEKQAKAKYDHDIAIYSINKTFESNKAVQDTQLANRMSDAKKAYDTAVNPAQEAYDTAVEAAMADYAKATMGAEAAAAAAIKDANDAYDVIEALADADLAEALEDAYDEYSPYWDYVINPWAEVVLPTVGSAF